ncbi:MAG: hypothetical protein JWM34_1333 [Ilumatobacteraceae bacterium]|nr:hypothetical protein [Ilumatobacteraceae bacterium]
MSTTNPMTGAYAPPATQVEDGGFKHFLRFFFVGLAMGLLSYVIVGIVWQAISYSKVGYRKRDILFALVPIWGIVVAIRCGWRYTAKNVYWTPRDDRPSSSLFSK